MDRAAGGNPPGGYQQVGFFQGRVAATPEPVAWLGQTDSTVKVVTGKPGVGKSALLGILACTAHPSCATPRTAVESSALPAAGLRRAVLRAARAAAHAGRDHRGLARQLGLGPLATSSSWLRQLTGLDGDLPVILVDAVDEARDPQALATAAVAPSQSAAV